MRLGPPSRGGKGYAICDRSGHVVPAEQRVRDHRAGLVAARHADTTPGFGTLHPVERFRMPEGPDPRPIADPRPQRAVIEPSAADRFITDQERLAALREGRAPVPDIVEPTDPPESEGD